MRELRGTSIASQPLALALKPLPPGWIHEMLPVAIGSTDETPAPGVQVSTRRSDPFSLVSVTIAAPPDKDADEFAAAAATLYRLLAAEVAKQRRHAVRIWNFVPDIQGPIAGAGDRYMAFNLGRYAVYSEWFGGPDAFRTSVPTSSAVGISEDVLCAHALLCEQPGSAVENPRQIPAYRYSRRYGIRPPCFARATRVDRTLFIGGTASIVGERSSHPDDIEAQTRETFRNISALIQAGADRTIPLPLANIRSLRVHVRESDDAPAVLAIIQELDLDNLDLEVVQAPLCRKELLVEIEGVAAYL